jgi:hypothetical protein
MLTDAELDALLSNDAARTTFVNFKVPVVDHEFDKGVIFGREAGIPCRTPSLVSCFMFMAEPVIDCSPGIVKRAQEKIERFLIARNAGFLFY